MNLVLTKGYKEKMNELETLFNENGITIYGDVDVQSVFLSNGSQLLMLGNIVGIRESGYSMRKITKKALFEFEVCLFRVEITKISPQKQCF